MHGGEFPGFSFCLLYLRLGTKEDSNLEIQLLDGGGKKTQQPKPILYSQSSRKRNRLEKEKLDSNHSSTAKHHRKSVAPTPTHSRKSK